VNNENLNKRLNDFVERDNTKFTQLNTVIDLLIKENQEMKALIQNQKFVIQPINPYNYQQNNPNGTSNGGSMQANTGNPQMIVAPAPQSNGINAFQDSSFLPNATPTGSSSTNGAPQSHPQHSPISTHIPQQQQQQAQPQQHQQQQQHSHQSHHQQTSAQSTPHQQLPQVSSAGANGSNGGLDNAMGDHTTNGSMIRFINNQYVDDSEAQLNATNTQPSSATAQNQRIDFVFMDPSSNKRNQYRVHSNSVGGQGGSVGGGNGGTSANTSTRQDDDSLGSNSETQITLPSTHTVDSTSTPNTSSIQVNTSRLQRAPNRQSEFDAENYDLIIHNDFNKVEDVYYEYYNSLKPQVEKVSKAYKVKKIRKYQKIKALAVRIDRYKKLKNCSIDESFRYFENLRLGSDNRKKSVAWLYNSLPDVLKKVGLEDQLKKSGSPNE